MRDCTSMGCPNPGTVSGVYDDGDERARVTYCTECAAVLSGEFTPDAPAAPDRPGPYQVEPPTAVQPPVRPAPDCPGDRDQQQAAEVLGRRWHGSGVEEIAAALAQRDREVRAEVDAQWRAKIEAEADWYDKRAMYGGALVWARIRGLIR